MDINDIEIVAPTYESAPIIERFSVNEGSLIVLKYRPGVYLRIFIDVNSYDFIQSDDNKKIGANNFITDYYICHPKDLHAYGRYSAFTSLMPKNSFISIDDYNRILRNLVSELPHSLDFEEKSLPSYEEYKELCQYAFAVNLLTD